MDHQSTTNHSSTGAILATLLLPLLLIPLLFPKYSRKSIAKTTNPARAPEPSGAWPLIGHLHLLGGSNEVPACKILGALADKHGPLFSLRFGIHDLLVVSGWEAVKECLTTNDLTLATRASIAVGKHLGYDNAIMGLAPYGPYWRHLRKMATVQLLSSHRVEAMTHVRVSELNQFLKEVHAYSREGGVINMSELLERLAFNMSLRMVVGKRFDGGAYMDEMSDARRYKEAVEEAERLCGVFVASDAVPWLERLDLGGHVRAMKKAAKVIDQVVGDWLEERVRMRRQRRRMEGADQDFMDVMMSNLEDHDFVSSVSGHSTDTIIKATTMILTLTGSGSTSITVIWALSLLLNHPNALNAAKQELDRVVGRERWVEDADIGGLNYLQAIVKETLRLYPPGPLTGIREAMDDCCIGGHHVPKGTRVVINIWKLHRDPRVWDDPGVFRPERFVTGDGADVDVMGGGQSFKYIPFSYGRRSCPAVNLGMKVVMLVVGRVIQGFDLETPAGLPVDMGEGHGIALPKVDPLQVVATPRLGSVLYEDL